MVIVPSRGTAAQHVSVTNHCALCDDRYCHRVWSSAEFGNTRTGTDCGIACGAKLKICPPAPAVP
eukprot:2875537-Rhodomonas_salina.1